MHWATKYVGKPWVSGARGPDVFDCWGLLYWVYLERYGVELPLYEGIDAQNLSLVTRMINAGAQEHQQWSRITDPHDGCAVGMSSNIFFHHVGIYCAVDGGMVLHCADGRGVVAQSLVALKSQGWNRVEYFSHHGTCYLRN